MRAPGDAVVHFPSERVIHTGDLLVSSGAPFCDTAYGGRIKDWDSTVRKILGMLGRGMPGMCQELR